MKTLQDYLQAYSKWQGDILLISRDNPDKGFRNKTTFDKGLDPAVHYNHRNILDNEVVVEFDNEDFLSNYHNALRVAGNCAGVGLKYSVWFSGNRSTHVHVWFDLGKYGDLKLIKRLLLDWLSRGCTEKPDYQLAIRRHFIRAEFGLHEKTGKNKTRMEESRDYPELGFVPPEVMSVYKSEISSREKFKSDKPVKTLHPRHPLIQQIMNGVGVDDGRQRLLYMLVHVYKPFKTKEEVLDLLTDWYKQTGGKKLTRSRIKRVIDYQWEQNYTFTETSFREVLSDIGIEEVTNGK